MSDEFVLDTPVVRSFVDEVRAAIGRAGSADEACDLIRPWFAEQQADGEWLPEAYREPTTESGMGGGGQWLPVVPATGRSCSSHSWCRPGPRHPSTTTSRRPSFDPASGEAAPFRSGTRMRRVRPTSRQQAVQRPVDAEWRRVVYRLLSLSGV